MERDALSELVARNLGLLIEASGTNAAELARSAKINPTGVYDILKGKSRSPRLDTLHKLAVALSVPLALFFEDELALGQDLEIVRLYHKLPPRERKQLLVTAEAWLDEASAS